MPSDSYRRLETDDPEDATTRSRTAISIGRRFALTYAVYIMELLPTEQCVHSAPYEFYVGSTHESPNHPAAARIDDHLQGHKSKVLDKGYEITDFGLPLSGLPTRKAAEKAEGEVARQLRKSGHKVWSDK